MHVVLRLTRPQTITDLHLLSSHTSSLPTSSPLHLMLARTFPRYKQSIYKHTRSLYSSLSTTTAPSFATRSISRSLVESYVSWLHDGSSFHLVKVNADPVDHAQPRSALAKPNHSFTQLTPRRTLCMCRHSNDPKLEDSGLPGGPVEAATPMSPDDYRLPTDVYPKVSCRSTACPVERVIADRSVGMR